MRYIAVPAEQQFTVHCSALHRSADFALGGPDDSLDYMLAQLSQSACSLNLDLVCQLLLKFCYVLTTERCRKVRQNTLSHIMLVRQCGRLYLSSMFCSMSFCHVPKRPHCRPNNLFALVKPKTVAMYKSP